MKIIIATDSHKGCMTSEEAGNIIASAVRSAFEHLSAQSADSLEVEVIPVADGGEGTVDALVSALNGEYKSVTVRDPLGREITAKYGIIGTTAVMEMAVASGLTLLSEDERNPLKTSTFGTGQMILDALESGCRDIIIGIGGSATNDGGAGMAEALGVKFFDAKGNKIQNIIGGNLGLIEKIDMSGIHPAVKNINIRVACDVKNPICGENGAAHVFAGQKGADASMRNLLDGMLYNLARQIENSLGVDVMELEGGGAAGGLGTGLYAFCGGKLQIGFSIIADTLKLEEKIKSADLVITGEGRTDSQTAFGKLPCGIGEIAKKHNVTCIIVSGAVSGDVSELYKHGITAVFSSVTDVDTRLVDALKNAKVSLANAVRNMIRLYHKGR